MGSKILFVTTDQQRYDASAAPANTIARTPVVDSLASQRDRLPPSAQPEHGVHAGTLDDDHRPVRAHPRVSPTACRCPSTRRRWPATCTTPWATAPRSWARPTSNPGSTPTTSGRRTRLAHDGFDGALQRDSTTSSWPCTGTCGSGTTTNGSSQRAAVAATPTTRSSTRPAWGSTTKGAATPTPPRSSTIRCPRDVPHRLGRRPHHRLAGLAGSGRRLVLLDELPRSPPSLGPARGRGAAPGRLARPGPARRATRDRREKAVEILAQKPHHWLDWYEGRFQNMEGGPMKFVPGQMTARPGARGERPHPRGERAHRRGAGTGDGPGRGAGLGRRHRRRVHDGPRRAPGRLRAPVQRARITSTP